MTQRHCRVSAARSRSRATRRPPRCTRCDRPPRARPIRLEGIEKVYRTDRIETVALSGINLEVGEGEFISIMGPSGCGKSTLLNLIGLLDVPTQRTGDAERRAVTSYDRPRARDACAIASSDSSSRRFT